MRNSTEHPMLCNVLGGPAILADVNKVRRVLHDRGIAGVGRVGARRVARAVRRLKYLSKVDLLRARSAFHVAGSVVTVPKDNLWAFSDGTYYERNVEYWFRQALASFDSPVVYDVGANYGYYTFVAAPVARTVYAFEPVSRTFAVLAENIRRNELRNVTPLQLALGTDRGSLTMTLYSASANNTGVARSPEAVRHLSIEGVETVPVERLDDLLAGGRVARADLLKIDTEGGELAILRGATHFLRKYRPTVILEHDEQIARDAGYTLGTMLAELRGHGYEVRVLSDPFADDGTDLTLYNVEAAPSLGTLVAFAPGSLCFD